MKTMRITESDGTINEYPYNDKLPNFYLSSFLLDIVNTYPYDVTVDFIEK